MLKLFRRFSNPTVAVLLSMLMVALALTSASASVSAPSGKNTARRNVNASALSTQAVTYYTDETAAYTESNTVEGVYQKFISLSEAEKNDSSDSYTVSQGNSLYTALYNIMDSTQVKANIPTYGAYGNKALATYWLTTDSSYLDSSNNNSYTFFYSDVSCENHEKMQREHIWPKSQATFYEHNGGADLHHLRPAYGTVNNIKSNWGFATLKDSNGEFIEGCTKTKKVQWPAGETALWRATYDGTTFIDVKDDVRGDIARVLLYVYTRWQQPNLYSDVAAGNLPTFDDDDSVDGGKKIFHDLPTLLDWMENDPVSEWEMKRNDLTENIEGNRNVFIDYPELAWLLFDQEVPTSMDTPSGEAKNSGSFNPSTQVQLDYSTINNGVAEITAVDKDAGNMPVKSGDIVTRGHTIKYTIKPNGSTIAAIREFRSDSDASGYRTIVNPNQNTEYSFEKVAGHYDPNNEDYKGYEKERIKITLNSDVCEVAFKISNVYQSNGSSGGSGSGMVTARYAEGENKDQMIENGDTVPNGTKVTLTFTPDFGSKYYDGLTINGGTKQTATNIPGTDSYTYTTTLDLSSNTVARKKTFNVKFSQTFDKNSSNHIDNSGMWPDENDPWGTQTDFSHNFEICGTQVKQYSDANNKALRFISVIDSSIIDKAQEYGYIIGYTNQNLDTKTINRNAFTLVRNGSYGMTVDCTGTDNTVYDEYGDPNENTNYKYVTAVVKNIQDAQNIDENTTIVARPYVLLKPEYRPANGPSVIYGQYVDASTGEAYCACSGSYNHISSLTNAQ